ncbi:MAG: histidine phosphatase family protein [Alphaproteobacteria bacterium]|nr:histidine phosphatase family protein [Alphaproteobacteria bacterium]
MVLITKWWWIRHAPVLASSHYLYGQQDIPADCSNEKSFLTLAHMLPHDAVWIITPLQRTYQTATMLQKISKQEILFRTEDNFIEQNFGGWQGLSYDEINNLNKNLFNNRSLRFLAHAIPPDGESFNQLVQRVSFSIKQINELYKGRDIIVITHAGTIRSALAFALGLEGGQALQFNISCLSLTRLDHINLIEGESLHQNENWKIHKVNHLYKS